MWTCSDCGAQNVGGMFCMKCGKLRKVTHG